MRLFAGHSRVMSRKPTCPGPSEVPGEPVLPATSGPPVKSGETNYDVHPSVLKYLYDDPIANAPEHTVDSTLLAWFRNCDPPGLPDITLENRPTVPYNDQDIMEPTTLQFGIFDQPSVTNGNEQWMSFLTEYNIIDQDARMEDVVGATDSNSTEGSFGDFFY